MPAPANAAANADAAAARPESLCGVILAGGRSSRMGGGDKTLLTIGGQTLLTRCIDRLAPQVEAMALNANGDPARFAAGGLPVIADATGDYDGPLAGVLSGLAWMRTHAPHCRRLLTVAGDTPLFPADLASRLCGAAAQPGVRLAVAASGGRTHPVFALWPVDLYDDLRRAVADDGVRKVFAFIDRYPTATVVWDAAPFDPFFNVNTPADAVTLAGLLSPRR